MRMAGQAVVVLKLVLVVTVFDPWARDTFTLPKSAVSHALAFVLLGLVVAGFAIGVDGLRKLSWVDAAVAAVLIAFALASLAPVDRTLALYGASNRFLGLTHEADLAITYVAIRAFFVTKADWRRMLAGSLAAAVPVIGYAFLQRFGLDPIHFLLDTTRPISTLGNQDIAGGYLGIVLATSFGGALLLWNVLRPGGRALFVVLTAACGIAMIFVGIRAGVLGAMAGGGAAAVLAVRTRDRAVRRRSMLIAGAAGLGLVAVVLVSPLGARFNVSQWSTDPAVIGRIEIWRVALVAASERPLFGLGPDSLIAVSSTIRSEASVALTGPNIFQDSTHNAVLHALTSAGLLGATAFVLLVVLSIGSGIRAARAGHWSSFALVPLSAYVAQSLVNVNDVALDWIPYACAAAVAGWSGSILVLPRPKAVGADRWLLAAICVGLALWPASLPLGRIGASESEQRAIALMDAGRPLEGVDPARQAIAVDPGRARYWSTFGTVLTAAGSRSAAISAYREAVAREPWQSLYWRNIALAALGAGDRPLGVSSLHRALELDPFDAISLDLLARLAFNDGDYAASADYAFRAARADPPRPETYDVVVLAAAKTGRVAEAEAALIRGIGTVDSTAMRLLLAHVERDRGNTAEALAQLRIVLEREPTNADALQLRHAIAP